MRGRDITDFEAIFSKVVTIDHRRCNGCLRCYDLCSMDVFAVDESTRLPTVAHEEDCYLCGVCWMECPKRAIDLRMDAAMY